MSDVEPMGPGVTRYGELWAHEVSDHRTWLVSLGPNPLVLVGFVHPVGSEAWQVLETGENVSLGFPWWVAIWHREPQPLDGELTQADVEAIVASAQQPAVAGWGRSLGEAVAHLAAPTPV